MWYIDIDGMTKRTQQTKLTMYRRHAAKTCSIAKSDKRLDQCECPLWVHGKVNGKFIRQSLDTRKLATAEMRKDDMINGRGGNDDDPNGGIHVVGSKNAEKGNETLEYAAKEFLSASGKLSTSSKNLYRRAVGHFNAWASKQELIYLRNVEPSHINQYFDECGRDWKKTTSQGRLTHLRVFFNYCANTRRWIQYTPTADRKLNHKAKSSKSLRVPFTPAEITKILSAVELMPESDRDRARALILLLLYTGMRISDATFFERSYLTERNTADYFVIKTRKQISLPPEVHVSALDALKKLDGSRVYFFVADTEDDYREARAALREGEEFSTLIPGYEAKVRETTSLVLKVLALAGLTGACHRFRDTFAINLLVGGADIFTVSQMLGHSDVKITQEHYMKLVPGYRERMSQATRVLSYEFPKVA